MLPYIDLPKTREIMMAGEARTLSWRPAVFYALRLK